MLRTLPSISTPFTCIGCALLLFRGKCIISVFLFLSVCVYPPKHKQIRRRIFSLCGVCCGRFLSFMCLQKSPHIMHAFISCGTWTCAQTNPPTPPTISTAPSPPEFEWQAGKTGGGASGGGILLMDVGAVVANAMTEARGGGIFGSWNTAAGCVCARPPLLLLLSLFGRRNSQRQSMREAKSSAP